MQHTTGLLGTRPPVHHQRQHQKKQQTTSIHATQQQEIQSAPFPKCATEVLNQINEFVIQRGQNPNKSWNRVKVKELQKHIDNNLFCLTPDRRNTRLNQLQYLKLLGIVCNYFKREVSNENDPQLRYLHFDIIFCGREGEGLLHERRVKFLVKICSLAAQFPVYSLFEHVAYWLSKVSSNELKRSYADQIVVELFDGFLVAPEQEKLYEYLLPLGEFSCEFCVIFAIFAIEERQMNTGLALLLSEWFATRIEQFLRYLSQNSYLYQPFCAQKFDLLLQYDCSESAALHQDSEHHHRLHAMLTEISYRWESGGFEINPAVKHPISSTISSTNGESFLRRPMVSSLQEAFQRYDSLPSLAQMRLLENIISCLRAGFLSSSSMNFKKFLASLESTKYLTGPHASLWQSLLMILPPP